MREQLIRYLLGELDADERRELRAMLRDNPELQQELAHLRECLAENQDFENEPLPPGRLAERTAELVSNSDEYDLEPAPPRSAMQAEGEPPSGVLGWSLADLAVAGGVILAVSMLVFPALRDSRDGTRLRGCQKNLYELWVLDSSYAANHGGYFPQVRPHENTGIVAAELIKGDYVAPDQLAMLLTCPASRVADQVRKTGKIVWIPNKEEMRGMTHAQLMRALANSSTCYGYRLAQKLGDDYVYVRSGPHGDLAFDPLLGDICDDSTSPATSNHPGSVIQIIGRGGNLKSFTTKSPPVCGNDSDLYRNDLGFVDVGLSSRDAVLAPSDALPALDFGSDEKLKW
jgi:hypothetical protein